MRGQNPVRAERFAELERLLEEGCTSSEAAAAMGVSGGYVRDLRYDPDGSKTRARKDGYAGTCRCGRKTNGSAGPGRASRTCAICAADERRGNRKWSPEVVVDALRRWAAAHGGRAPRAADWQRADPENGYPACTSCYGLDAAFATWNDALRAAGLKPHAEPRRRAGRARKAWTEDEALTQIRAFAVREGRVPSTQDFTADGELPTPPAVYRLFGGVPTAVRAAGLVPLPHREFVWTRQNALAAILAFAEREGRTPSSRDFDSGHGLPTMGPVRRLFGGTTGAAEAAGLAPARRRAHPRRPRTWVSSPRPAVPPRPEPEPEPLEPLDLPTARGPLRALAFRDDSGELEDEIGSGGANARPGPVLARVTLSRGAKILRLAQAMCRLRGGHWWDQTTDQRRAFVRLATFSVEALEAVEADEARMARTRPQVDPLGEVG